MYDFVEVHERFIYLEPAIDHSENYCSSHFEKN